MAPVRQQQAQLPQADRARFDVGAQQAREQLIHLFAVPVAIDIGFPQTQRPARQHLGIKAALPDLNVPGAVAVETHIGRGQQFAKPGWGIGVPVWR